MSLRIGIEGRVAHLLIDRADKRNAFTRAMWEAVPELLQEIAATEGVRALVLRSATPGGVFCAGADIAEMAENAADADWCAGQQAAINAAQLALARFALPTIAFVEGDAIGGGCALAMACDIRVATPQARFGITPSRLGLAYPLHDVKLLVDLVGPGQAKRLLFTGALIDAAEALRIGLVEVLDDNVAALLEAVWVAERAALLAAGWGSSPMVVLLVWRVSAAAMVEPRSSAGRARAASTTAASAPVAQQTRAAAAAVLRRRVPTLRQAAGVPALIARRS